MYFSSMALRNDFPLSSQFGPSEQFRFWGQNFESKEGPVPKEIVLHTSSKVEFRNITSLVSQALNESGLSDGAVIIYVPHTTAAVTINEGCDPSVFEDIEMELNKIVPWSDRYSHIEGNSAAHIKSSLIGVSKTVMVERGKLLLGRWQGIFFCEFDGPRTRKVWLKFIPASSLS
jgi:secondary thiamine-phosphate synthase enzyme